MRKMGTEYFFDDFFCLFSKKALPLWNYAIYRNPQFNRNNHRLGYILDYRHFSSFGYKGRVLFWRKMLVGVFIAWRMRDCRHLVDKQCYTVCYMRSSSVFIVLEHWRTVPTAQTG